MNLFVDFYFFSLDLENGVRSETPLPPSSGRVSSIHLAYFPWTNELCSKE